MAIQVPVVFRGDADDLVDDLDRSLRTRTSRLFAEFGREAADHFSHFFNKETEKFSTRFRSGFTGSLTAALQGAVIRDPRVLGLFAASIVALMPAIGSAAAGAFVLGFGTGLVGLGFIFAAQAEEVKKVWKDLGSDLADRMRSISEPFESTLITIANVARRTFGVFAPELRAAFAKLAPVVSGFMKTLGAAFAELAPTIQPVTRAFIRLLQEVAPRMGPFFAEVADGIRKLARAVAQNPDTIVDIFGGLLSIIPKLFRFLAWLTHAQTRLENFFHTLSNSRIGDSFRQLISSITNTVRDFFNILKGGNEIGQTFEAIKKFVQPLIPIFQKTAAAVGGALGSGLRDIAQVINDDLLPAFQRFLPAIQPIAKFLLNVLGTAVVEAFKGALQAIKGFIQIVAGVLDFFAALLEGRWSDAWGALKQIAVGAFNAIVGVVRVFLSVTILGAFRRFVVFLTKGLWVSLFKLLVSGAKKGFSAVARAFSSSVKFIIRVVTGFVRGVIRFFQNLFKTSVAIVKNGWNVMRSAFGGAGRAILTIVVQIFQAIGRTISSAWQAVVRGTTTAWNAVRNAVSSGVEKAISFVRSLPSKMASIIRGAAGALFAAGAALIQGLADGVAQKIGEVVGQVRSGLSKIKDMLPGSPIKSGPLKGWNGGKPGRELMELIAKGIKNGSLKALNEVAKALNGIRGIVNNQLGNKKIGETFADQIKSQLERMADRVEEDAKKITERLAKRLDFAQEIRKQFRAELDLDALATTGGTAGSFAANLGALATRIKNFAKKLGALKRLGIPRQLIQEIAALGSEAGIPVANQLLTASKAQVQQIRDAFSAFEAAAGGIGNSLANQQFGAPGSIRNPNRDRDRRRADERGRAPVDARVEINQIYTGPTTGRARMRELDWTMRYATRARAERIEGGLV